MLDFLSANYPTIIAGIIVFAIVGAAVWKIVSDRINNRSSCGCGCAGCPSAGICHPAVHEDK